MSKYIKGEAVANATSYELHAKDASGSTLLATKNEINFNLDELNLSAGTYTLAVKAKANGYEDSDFSNEVIYSVEDISFDITHKFSFVEQGGININNGTINTANGGVGVDTNWTHNDYLDVSEYSSIKITLIASTNPNSLCGCAFYDENKNYISGEKATVANAWGTETRTIEIPSNAKYIRTCWVNENADFYNSSWVFSCYAEV